MSQTGFGFNVAGGIALQAARIFRIIPFGIAWWPLVFAVLHVLRISSLVLTQLRRLEQISLCLFSGVKPETS
jgi:hypothetical protein